MAPWQEGTRRLEMREMGSEGAKHQKEACDPGRVVGWLLWGRVWAELILPGEQTGWSPGLLPAFVLSAGS